MSTISNIHDYFACSSCVFAYLHETYVQIHSRTVRLTLSIVQIKTLFISIEIVSNHTSFEYECILLSLELIIIMRLMEMINICYERRNNCIKIFIEALNLLK